MKLINWTYPTYPEEIKQELAVNSFTEGLRDPEISQIIRMARLKKIYEALVYDLQLETAKQTSRNHGRFIRRVSVFQDDRKTKEEIFMRLMKELSIKTFHRKNRIRCWKCGQERHVQSRCTSSTAPDSDPDEYQLHIADIGDEVRRSDLEKIFAPYGELKEVWLSNSIPCLDLLFTKIKKMLQLPLKLATELKYEVVTLE